MGFDITREQRPTPGTINLKGHTGFGLPVQIECATENGTPRGTANVLLEQIGTFTVSRSNLLGIARALVEAHNVMFPEGAYGTNMVISDGSAAFDERHGYEHEVYRETGQPNGVGTIEPSTHREWFTDERVSHDREVHTYTGPWEEKR